jgi:hypothetical protein
MAARLFNPLEAHCFDWSKINPNYRRHLDFDTSDPTCPECSKPGDNSVGLNADLKLYSCLCFELV